MCLNKWAGITQFAKTQLVVLHENVNANSYINTVLQPVVLPFLRRQFPNGHCLFQQDNAPAQRDRLTTQFFIQNSITVMDWPALSPDMGPIEHVWEEPERRVYSRNSRPNTVAELRHALVQEWANMP